MSIIHVQPRLLLLLFAVLASLVYVECLVAASWSLERRSLRLATHGLEEWDKGRLNGRNRNFYDVDSALRAQLDSGGPLPPDVLLRSMLALDYCQTRPSRLLQYWTRITLMDGVELNTQAIKSILAQSIPRSKSPAQKAAVSKILKAIRRADGVRLMDTGALNLYLQACFAVNSGTVAAQLLCTVLDRRDSHPVPLDAQSISILIKGLGQLGDVESARAAFEHFHSSIAQQSSTKSETIVHNVYLECLCRNAVRDTTPHERRTTLRQEALALYASMLDTNKADSFSLSSILTYYLSVEEEGACQLLWGQSVVSGKVRANPITRGIMIRAIASGCCRDAKERGVDVDEASMAEAIAFFAEEPDERTLKPLMFAFGKGAADPAVALACRDRMITNMDLPFSSNSSLASLVQGYHAGGRADLLVQCYALCYGPSPEASQEKERLGHVSEPVSSSPPAVRAMDVLGDVAVLNMLLASGITLATSRWEFRWSSPNGLVMQSIGELWLVVKTILRRRIALEQERHSRCGDGNLRNNKTPPLPPLLDSFTIVSGMDMANAMEDSTFTRYLWSSQRTVGIFLTNRALHSFLRSFGVTVASRGDTIRAYGHGESWAEGRGVRHMEELQEFRRVCKSLGAARWRSGNSSRAWTKSQVPQWPELDVRAVDELCNAALRLGGVPEARRALASVLSTREGIGRSGGRCLVPSTIALTHACIHLDRRWCDWNQVGSKDEEPEVPEAKEFENDIVWMTRLLAELSDGAGDNHRHWGEDDAHKDSNPDQGHLVTLWASVAAVPLCRGAIPQTVAVLRAMEASRGLSSRDVARALHLAVVSALDARVPLLAAASPEVRYRAIRACELSPTRLAGVVAVLSGSGPNGSSSFSPDVTAGSKGPSQDRRITCSILDVIRLLECMNLDTGNSDNQGRHAAIPVGVSLLQMLFHEAIAARRAKEGSRLVRVLDRARLVLDLDGVVEAVRREVDEQALLTSTSSSGEAEVGAGGGNVALVRMVLARRWAARLVGTTLRRARVGLSESMKLVVRQRTDGTSEGGEGNVESADG